MGIDQRDRFWTSCRVRARRRRRLAWEGSTNSPPKAVRPPLVAGSAFPCCAARTRAGIPAASPAIGDDRQHQASRQIWSLQSVSAPHHAAHTWRVRQQHLPRLDQSGSEPFVPGLSRAQMATLTPATTSTMPAPSQRLPSRGSIRPGLDAEKTPAYLSSDSRLTATRLPRLDQGSTAVNRRRPRSLAIHCRPWAVDHQSPGPMSVLVWAKKQQRSPSLNNRSRLLRPDIGSPAGAVSREYPREHEGRSRPGLPSPATCLSPISGLFSLE